MKKKVPMKSVRCDKDIVVEVDVQGILYLRSAHFATSDIYTADLLRERDFAIISGFQCCRQVLDLYMCSLHTRMFEVQGSYCFTCNKTCMCASLK